MKNEAQNIITAMKISGVTSLSEGSVYDCLLNGYGLNPNDATLVVKEMLDSGKVKRNGCALFLAEYSDNHDQTDTVGRRALYAS